MVAPYEWVDPVSGFLCRIEASGHDQPYTVNGRLRDRGEPRNREILRFAEENADLRGGLDFSKAQVADLVAWKERLAAEVERLRGKVLDGIEAGVVAALEGDRACLRPLLERCEAAVAGLQYEGDRSQATANLLADLRCELGRPEEG